MKRLIADNDGKNQVIDYIQSLAQSSLGQEIILQYWYQTKIQTTHMPAFENKSDIYDEIANGTTDIFQTLDGKTDFINKFINKIQEFIKKNKIKYSIDEDDLILLSDKYAFNNYPKNIFNTIYNKQKNIQKENKKQKTKNNLKYKDAYDELLNKDDHIGDNVKTESSFDSYNGRFVYLDGNILMGKNVEHVSILNDLYKKLGYQSAEDYIQDGHPNPKFYAGRCKDGVAVLELDNFNINNNADVLEVANALKNKGMKKVYICENRYGEAQNLKRIAKKRLIKQ